MRPRHLTVILTLSALAIGLGLGSSSRLSYHEAIQAQAAREMIASRAWLVPTLGHTPWLEKPPLAYWMVACLGSMVGCVDETVARLPSALAGLMTVLAVATLSARRFGPRIGLLSALVQSTALWLVARSRLSEPDVPLAAVIAWSMVAFDRVRQQGPRDRWPFFLLLGLSSLLKGVGFGAALILATVATVLAWDRDPKASKTLLWPLGWLLAALLSLSWPLLVVALHPEALNLWFLHVSDRLSAHPEHFAGESWWTYAPSPLEMMLPWTPLALLGAWRSLKRAHLHRSGPDRLLIAWAVVPVLLLSLASTRNAHYLIHALAPWSIWTARSLTRLSARLRRRGWPLSRRRRAARLLFLSLALAWGLGFALLGPSLDARGKGAEWAFYEHASRLLNPHEPLAVLYDALDRPDRWDKAPYPTPFGPVPADLPVRLFYLHRPISWPMGLEALDDQMNRAGSSSFALIARPRDEPFLSRLGRVQKLETGPTHRWDRTFALYRVEQRGLARSDPRLMKPTSDVRSDILKVRLESPDEGIDTGVSPMSSQRRRPARTLTVESLEGRLCLSSMSPLDRTHAVRGGPVHDFQTVARDLNLDTTRNPYVSYPAWMRESPRVSPFAGPRTTMQAAVDRAWATLWADTQPPSGAWKYPVVTPGDSYDTGIWLWDSGFHVIGLSHGGPSARRLALGQIQEMLTAQTPDGMVPREIHPQGPLRIGGLGIQAPGILTYAANQLYDTASSPRERASLRASLARIYPQLVQNDQWFTFHTDAGRGLVTWSGLDSGWDTSPRWSQPQPVKEALDLNCWLYLDRVQLAQMARILRRPADSAFWQSQAESLKARIQQDMWNPVLGVFNDTLADGSVSNLITPVIMMPMFVGVATPAQAASTVAHLTNPAELSTPFGLSSVAQNDPGFSPSNYWRGPVWINLNWMAVRALESYGYRPQARDLETRVLNLVASSKKTYEYYNTQTGQGLGSPDYGWTAALFVDLAVHP